MVRKTLVAALLLSMACGKRGDPRPPVPVIPQATSDLVVTQRGDQVLLSWSYPALTTAGRSLTGIRRISVFRYVEDLPASAVGADPQTLVPGSVDPTQPRPIVLFSKIPTIPQAQFVKLSERIDSIESANLASATAGAKLIYADSPPFRTSDGRPVRVTYAVVTEGEAARGEVSNLASVVPLPVATAPAGLVASAKPEGVVLTWQEPTRSVKGEEAPIISGYRIYRLAPGEAPGDFIVPITTAPLRTTTYTDVPPYGEHAYRVAAVAAEEPMLIQSALSQEARVTFRDLVPPPVPKNLSPLVETNAVRLIWDPVEAPDLAGYRIYRAEGIGHTDVREAASITLVSAPIADTNYLDTTPSLGIAYRYSVTAVGKSGNESEPVRSAWIVAPKTP